MVKSKTKQRLGGISINWITIIIQVLISLFFIPFFLKTVGDIQYGLYSFSTSLIAWLDTLMVAIASAYYKFLTREKKKFGEYGEARACGVFWKIFLVISVLVLAAGLLFDALLYSGTIPLKEYSIAEKNQICLIILFSTLSTTISSFLMVYKSYQYYKQKYILIYSFSLGQILLQTILSVIFLKKGYGVVAVAAIHFGIAVLLTLVLSLFSKFILKEKVAVRSIDDEDKKYRKKLFLEILVFSSFVIINTVVDVMNKSLDKTILGFYNSESVATYQLAYTIPSYLISFTSIISIVYVQKMNDCYYNGGGTKEMNELFLKVSKAQSIFAFLIIGGFIACGKEFVFLWLDDSRINVYYVSCILMVVYSITCCNRLAIISRRVQNFHIKASIIYFCVAIFNVVFSVILVNIMPKKDAIWACVIGTVSTYLLGHWLVMSIYDQKVTKLNMISFYKIFLKYMIIALTIDLLVYRVDRLIIIDNTIVTFVVKGISFALLFGLCVFFIDRTMFLNALNKIRTKFKKNSR